MKKRERKRDKNRSINKTKEQLMMKKRREGKGRVWVMMV